MSEIPQSQLDFAESDPWEYFDSSLEPRLLSLALVWFRHLVECRTPSMSTTVLLEKASQNSQLVWKYTWETQLVFCFFELCCYLQQK